MQVSKAGWPLDMADQASSMNAMNLDAKVVEGENSLKDATVTHGNLAKITEYIPIILVFGMFFVLFKQVTILEFPV